MKKELVKNILRLSPLEAKVYSMIMCGEIYSWQIAEAVFKRSRNKPKSVSNSVTSAVRQINRKLEKCRMSERIVGQFNGREGKLLWIEK